MLHTGRQVDWVEEGNDPVQVRSKGLLEAARAVDDLLAVPHRLVAEVVAELQVECCWHMDMGLLAGSADSRLVVLLITKEMPTFLNV